MHIKPPAGCQISTLIFEKIIVEGDLYNYPMKNISRTAKFLPVGLRCIIPARYLRHLKTRAITLI
jgi:hypothetical protein